MTKEFYYKATKLATPHDEGIGRNPLVELVNGTLNATDMFGAMKAVILNKGIPGEFYSVLIRDLSDKPEYTSGLYLSPKARMDRLTLEYQARYMAENSGLMVDVDHENIARENGVKLPELFGVAYFYKGDGKVASVEQTANDWKPLEDLTFGG